VSKKARGSLIWAYTVTMKQIPTLWIQVGRLGGKPGISRDAVLFVSTQALNKIHRHTEARDWLNN
jgi:hypothetical protein